jgi:hypothetical protein
MFPDLNVLFLDMDADTSEANMHNRLEFFVRNAIASNEKAYGFQANFKGRLKTCEKI